MQNILDVRQVDAFRSQVVLEPLLRGFGHTLGNSLRRVLLSSMPGYAVTEVVIKGVKHEYSTIEGVQEDVINLLLNLKGVRFVLKDTQDATVSLKFKGPGVVKASDIELPHNVEILNPAHVIANVAQAITLEMQIRVKVGKGYVPATQLQDRDETTESQGSIEGNVIHLDASFSPVRKVSYAVENARVEQRTDFDKLILDIETDGSIRPEEAVKTAAGILQQQLAAFSDIPLEETSKVTRSSNNDLEPFLSRPIEELELTVRSVNSLKSENIVTIRDLVLISEDELLKLPNLGKKSMSEIKEVLSRHGLYLGMDVE